MANGLHLKVVTPERTLLDVPLARKVRVKLEDGAWLSIYAHHAPLVARLLPGPLHYEVAAEAAKAGVSAGEIVVPGGLLRVTGDEVVVLTHGALASEAAASDEVQEDARAFDRLARQLMISLGAKAGGVLAHSEDV